ncbi:MAG TPA: penicillin-binding protein 2 [Anaeromyxobacteraceae bacterium]|nr:penicillin-binding protein 2 [Anaeromyxobacteraceae bacterium]
MVGVPPPASPAAGPGEFRPRIFWMTAVVSVAFLVLIGRLYQLQILRGDEYKERADENFVKELRVPADRGFILDKNRRILVDSRPSYDVTLTPYFCGKTCDDVLADLGKLLVLSDEELERSKERLRAARGLERFRPFTVKVDIAREELDVVEAHRVPGALSGVDVIPAPHRNYRFGSWGSHLFGYMNEIGPDELKKADDDIALANDGELPYQLGDYIGRRGLERRYERQLRGVDGRRRVVVDAKGNAKGGELEDLIPESQRFEASRPGENLVLSIDWRLQEFAEKFFPGTAGTVLALDAKTGFLLALVDRPAPDPNKLSGRISRAELLAIHNDPLRPELFRAIQEHYHPGSTFKVVTSIAALEEGALKPGGTVFCPGHYTLGNHRWRCDKEQGHGSVDLEHALGASCDVFYYALGDRLGTNRIAKWGGLLGLGRPTGFDIGGEAPGVMPDEEWHQKHIPGGYQHGMSLNIAIGQGDVNVTPMQELVLYGALASGIVWKPQVVERIEDPNGEAIQEFAPSERGRLPIKKETRDQVMKGLWAAVNEPFGTGYGSRLKDIFEDGHPVVMGGKTGTAQVVKLGTKRLKASQVSYFERDHAWFAAFAPLDDPEIVVLVLNEHSGFGASNAAPTASAVVRRYFELKLEDEMVKSGMPAYGPPPPPPKGGDGVNPAPEVLEPATPTEAAVKGDRRGA